MKDAFGNTLNIGDEVVFVYGKNNRAKLDVGKVTKIYTTSNKLPGLDEECSVDNHSHILSFRVAKISTLNE